MSTTITAHLAPPSAAAAVGLEPPRVTPAEANARLARVVTVERDPLLRAGIRAILDAQDEIQVVGEYDGVPRESLTDRPVDVLLLGSEHLSPTLKSLVPRMAERWPGHDLAVVAIVRPGDHESLRAALRYVAQCYVDRDACHRDLVDAVRAAHAARTYLSSSIATIVVEWMARAGREPVPSTRVEHELTEREIEIFVALGDGMSNTAIARRLRIKEATVRSHIYHILEKLDLRTRTEAVLAGHGYTVNRTVRFPPALGVATG